MGGDEVTNNRPLPLHVAAAVSSEKDRGYANLYEPIFYTYTPVYFLPDPSISPTLHVSLRDAKRSEEQWIRQRDEMDDGIVENIKFDTTPASMQTLTPIPPNIYVYI